MNIKSTQLTEAILTEAEVFYARVHTPFLQIPNEILPSNSKIILIVLQALASMTYSAENHLHDFNNEAMSKFTGIPTGTINRILAKIETQTAAANQWLIDNNFSERLQLTKIEKFGRATIYSYLHRDPVIQQRFNAAIASKPDADTEKPAKRYKTNENYVDKDLKEKALKKSGLAIEDLEFLYKYPLDRINRNVRYFLDKYVNKGKEANYNLLSKTLRMDYGKVYLNNKEKAAEYLKLVLTAIEIINNNLTPEIKEKISGAYKYNPPYDVSKFESKSDVLQHCNYKINELPPITKQALLGSADLYIRYVKYTGHFTGKTEETMLEICKIAALQIIHNALDLNPIITNKAA